MTISEPALDLLRHLATRPGHDEVKADFRQLLVAEFGVDLAALEFERRVPEVRGRQDALIGRTVFEAKSDLDREWRDVERRMPDYLADRQREEGERFIGIASDGLRWAVFELTSAGALAVVKRTDLDPETPGAFLAWLDGALALKSSLPPDPMTVRAELGHDSVAYYLVNARLRELWERIANTPATALQRQLWAELLKQVYGRDVNSDALWYQHTYLVIVAKCIALAVLGLREDDPALLLSGEAFSGSGIHGAVESDFFDWVVAEPDGEALVRRIMGHVRRFRLSEVESDVLKVLYESLIDRDERHGLGEYYTPDWLAAKVIRQVVDRPTDQRVLDPACGSGTFLFHAVRRFIADAIEAGFPPARWAEEVCAHVAGMDVHPVAVIIARVTYLLAMAPALAHRTGQISIPVYLGDALQLSITEFMTGKELTIRVPPPPAGTLPDTDPKGGAHLNFPETFCRDPGLFDKAIARMRSGSETGMTRPQIESALRRITEQHYREDVTHEQELAIQDLGRTYVTFDRLRQEGRDSVWGYVARNLSRPLFLSAAGGWAQVLVGNPPWVAFRYMNEELQKRFKSLAKEENIFVGGKLATHNDLCALFTARATSLYLRSGGRLGLVLPLAVLSRGQFKPIRRGAFASANIAWDDVWTMDDSVQPLFPVPACAVFGRRRAVARPLPETVRAYSGTLPLRDAPEAIADARLKVTEGAPALAVGSFQGGSAYRSAFRQGATLVPRMTCFVDRAPIIKRLGSTLDAAHVLSRRSPQEKEPWKSLPGIAARVETEFLRPVLLGESILPYRVFRPLEAVIPISNKGKPLSAEMAADEGIGGLFDWMRKAEGLWNKNKSSDMDLINQFDYYGKLEAQFPLSPLRVVYAKAGAKPAACILRCDKTVVDHKLYWLSITDEREGFYLCAILNCETIRARAEQFQSRGQWGARDFDKVAFNLPIPRFNPGDPLHQALTDAAVRAEALAAAVEIPENIPFSKARALVRRALTEAGLSEAIDTLVAQLLGG